MPQVPQVPQVRVCPDGSVLAVRWPGDEQWRWISRGGIWWGVPGGQETAVGGWTRLALGPSARAGARDRPADVPAAP